jgi:hypothetical protein
MNATQLESWLAIALFLSILGAVEVGRVFGRRQFKLEPDRFGQGLGAIEGAVFALLGLLIAFTFSGAASRFEGRRHLITEEVNAISTAWLRLDLLPAERQPALRELFRRYVDLRIETYADLSDRAAVEAGLAASAALQAELWRDAVAGVGHADAAPGAPQLLLPALNEMFDIATTRIAATVNHPPLVIYLMLSLMCLAGGVMSGFGTGPMKRRSLLHFLAFAGLTSLAVAVIVDLEFPRRGLIRVDHADDLLRELRVDLHEHGH